MNSRRRVGFILAYIVFLGLLFEGVFRIYLYTQTGALYVRPSEIILQHYPVLRDVLKRDLYRDDQTMKVLFLGGSSLHPKYGDVVERIRAHLTREGIKANLINVADRALTTRDSLFQYETLGRVQFDAVVLYHGVNDVRANNCPPDIYREDYSHYAWYSEINTALRCQSSLRFTVIPYYLEMIAKRLHQRIKPDRYLAPTQA